MPETRLVTPRFSIFIPVWNGAVWIGRAIESVLAQTYMEWELVIGDNASTDVATVVGRYTDPRIRLHHGQRTPTSVKTSTGRCFCVAPNGSSHWASMIALCRTAWKPWLLACGRCPIDRFASARSCQRCVESTLGAVGRRLYYGRCGPAKIPNGVHNAASWLHYSPTGVNPWNIGTAAFARDVLAEMGGFPGQIGLCAEIDLVLRASTYGNILYIDEPLMDFTVRGDSDSQSRGFSERA